MQTTQTTTQEQTPTLQKQQHTPTRQPITPKPTPTRQQPTTHNTLIRQEPHLLEPTHIPTSQQTRTLEPIHTRQEQTTPAEHSRDTHISQQTQTTMLEPSLTPQEQQAHMRLEPAVPKPTNTSQGIPAPNTLTGQGIQQQHIQGTTGE